MAKITNPETLEAQQEIRQHIAMMIATLRAIDAAVRRDYRNSASNIALDLYDQAEDLQRMSIDYQERGA